MKSLIAILFLILFINGIYGSELLENQIKFKKFISDFNKDYSSNEFSRRFQIFQENLLKIDHLNSFEKEKVYGITKFSDLTTQEFSEKYLSSHKMDTSKLASNVVDPSKIPTAVPANFDWRNNKPPVVTPVKNEGQCGAVWAEIIVEEVESMWAIAGNKLVPLSVQQIVDCETTNSSGCNGGSPTAALEYVIKYGLESEESYPYNAQDNTCAYNSSLVVARVKNWAYVTTTKNETVMRDYLYENGPITACVDANSWQFYNGGIITSNCNQNIDFCVQITGYGTSSKGIDYWNLRVDWGVNWGENGYLQVERNKNLCGVADCVLTCSTK